MQNYSMGNGPRFVGIADLSGDGRPDIVSANTFANTISVRLGNGGGTFQPMTNYPVGNTRFSIAVANFNADNRPDLAVACNTGMNNLSVLLNNGNGTFQAAVPYAAGDGPVSVFAADIDGLGGLDLAVANGNSDNVSVLLNNGNGTFTEVGLESGVAFGQHATRWPRWEGISATSTATAQSSRILHHRIPAGYHEFI